MTDMIKISWQGVDWEVFYYVEDESKDSSTWMLCSREAYLYYPKAIVKTTSFEKAFKEAIDICLTVSVDEVWLCYIDPKTNDQFESKEEFDALLNEVQKGHKEHPEMLRGYYLQDNATGSGIVYLGEEWRLFNKEEIRLSEGWFS